MKPSKEDVESSVSNDFNGVEVNVGSKHTFPRGHEHMTTILKGVETP